MASLHNRLSKCKYNEGEEVFEWLARLASIFTQLRTAGVPVPDLEMKHRAMSLIADAQTWGAMAHLLGTGDGINATDNGKRRCLRRRKNSNRMG